MSNKLKSHLPRVPPVELEQLMEAVPVVVLGLTDDSADSIDPSSPFDDDPVSGWGDPDDGADERLKRAWTAVKKRYPEELAMPLFLRSLALAKMIQCEECSRYYRQKPSDPDEGEVHNCIFAVAAVMPLNPQLEFNRRTFFKRADDIFELAMTGALSDG